MYLYSLFNTYACFGIFFFSEYGPLPLGLISSSKVSMMLCRSFSFKSKLRSSCQKQRSLCWNYNVFNMFDFKHVKKYSFEKLTGIAVDVGYAVHFSKENSKKVIFLSFKLSRFSVHLSFLFVFLSFFL